MKIKREKMMEDALPSHQVQGVLIAVGDNQQTGVRAFRQVPWRRAGFGT